MYQMHLNVGGVGIFGASGGGMQIIVRWYDSAFVYDFLCQGMSSSAMWFGPVTMTNDVAGKSERMLLDLQYYDVKVTIPTSFVGWNKKVDFTFEIFENNSSDPIFKTTRRPLADGCCLGGITVLTTPTLIMQGSWKTVEQKLQEQRDNALREASWNPFHGITQYF